MYKTVILITTLIGAAVGVFSAITDGTAAMVVMGFIGAAFGCPVGAGLCALIHLFKPSANAARIEGMPAPHQDSGPEMDPFAQMKMAQQWSDERERSRIAEDLDSSSKSVTGW